MQGSTVIYNIAVAPIFKRYEKNVDELIKDLPSTVQKASINSSSFSFHI